MSRQDQKKVTNQELIDGNPITEVSAFSEDFMNFNILCFCKATAEEKQSAKVTFFYKLGSNIHLVRKAHTGRLFQHGSMQRPRPLYNLN